MNKKTTILDLEEYKLPETSKLINAFDEIPKIIARSGFNIFDYAAVFQDEATNTLIRQGNTIGCFYIESPGMRSLLKRTDCHTFEMLTAVSSVIRPGVAESGMMAEFIERHKNPSRVKYLVPELKKYLGETYGLMIYQEDVLKVAHHVVGLTLEESDLLRRSMSGKMRSRNAMKMIEGRFFSCCKAKGFTETISRSLWKQIESFAGYAFCKAHSASFALLSFQVAYLKAHHPTFFMAGVLSNQGGYYSAAVYMSEAKRMGIKILLPCVNKSEYEYDPDETSIRIGFMAIKNMEKSEADLIVNERNAKGKFSSLLDFVVRTQLSYIRCESLIKCGAMDCFNQTRPTLLRQLDIYYNSRKILDNMSNDLFLGESFKLEKELITDIDFNHEERCLYEYETFGYLVSKHPLDFYTDVIKANNIITSSVMQRYNNKRIRMLGWYMASKRIKTKKGDIMKFLSLEDLTGTFEAVIFPKAYAKYAELTLSMGPYLIYGLVDAQNGNTIIVDKLEVLSARQALSITEKDRNDADFFGDVEKAISTDEIILAESLDRHRLRQAYF